MVSTAFLPGDVQIGTGAGGLPAVFPYASEELTSYEIGSKNRFLDQRLQINLSAFRDNYGGYQASIQTNPQNPGSAILFNVPLQLTGAELETQFQLTPEDRIGFDFSDVDTSFHGAPPLFNQAVAQKGLWGFPPKTATLSYDHNFALPDGSSLDFHGEGIWRSTYSIEPMNPSLVAEGGLPYDQQKSFFLGNLSMTWMPVGDQFSVTGYARNIGDERYKTYTNVQSLANVQLMTPLIASGTQSDPRTFGVVVTAKF